jgi:vacuolar-type H+-ATPase subunit H
MSTDYTETLKKIKETEEATSRELLEKRKALEGELGGAEEDAAASISQAKRKAEELVAAEVEKARRAAQKEADALLAKSSKDAKEVAARKLDKAALKKIIDQTILSEFK